MINIRPAGLSDIAMIQNIAARTWPHAYAAILSSKQMGYMLHMMYSKQVLTRQMEQEQHHFFMADSQGETIGFAGASPYEDGLWKLHKLYVLPFAQKTGCGKALLQAILQLAKQAGAKGIVLNVNRNNAAVDFYKHQGFSIIATGDFDIGAGFFMNDYVMKKTWA